MSFRALAALTAALAAAALAPFAFGGAAGPPAGGIGGLSQLDEERGCVLENPPVSTVCARGRALDGASAVAVSPDGRNVYVAAANAGAIAVFARDQRTGSLQQLAGGAGCVGGAGCPAGPGLSGVSSVVVSPDGRNVYATSPRDNQIVVLVRDPATGALSFPPSPYWCVRESGGACRKGYGLLRAQAVVVSPDGQNVYVAGYDSDAITVFFRNPSTGYLSPLPGSASCVALSLSGCGAGPGLDGPLALAISPDGSFLVAASNVIDSISIFRRETKLVGQLTPFVCRSQRDTPGCARLFGDSMLDSPSSVAIGPAVDEAGAWSVWVASRLSNAVRRVIVGERGTSYFIQASLEWCTTPVRTMCAGTGPLDDPSGLAVSADGKQVYVASWGNLVTALNPDGTFLDVPGGCVSPPGTACARQAAELDKLSAIAVSPDGKNVYVTSFGSDGVIVLARQLPPVCTPIGLFVESGRPTDIALGCSDENGDRLQYTILTPPRNGTLGPPAATIAYTAAPGYTGADTFVYRAFDGGMSSALTTVTLTVRDTIAPVVKIAPGTVTLTRAGVARLRLTCPADEARCSGTLSLRSSDRRRLLLGSAGFGIAGGTTATVAVRISAAGRRAVAATRRLPSTASAAARDVAGNRRTSRRAITVRRA